MQNPLTSLINDWFESHFFVGWTVNHPLLSIFVLILIIFLVLGLLEILKSVIRYFGMFLLILPFNLIKLLFLTISKFSPVFGKIFTSSNQSNESQERIKYILERLNEINQEESQLTQELSQLLAKQVK